MATEPKKTGSTGKSASTGKTAAKPAAKEAAPDASKAIEARLSDVESAMQAAEQRLTQKATALETRIVALEQRGGGEQSVRLPAGVPDGVRQFVDRAAELVRRNPITALILIIAFLLVAIFS